MIEIEKPNIHVLEFKENYGKFDAKGKSACKKGKNEHLKLLRYARSGSGCC